MSDADVEYLRDRSTKVHLDGAYGENVILTLEDAARLRAIADRLEGSVPIPVSEQLPEDVIVLAWDGDSWIRGRYSTLEGSNGMLWWCADYFGGYVHIVKQESVTHWLPLPPLP